jgi:hypothetical protein
MYKVELYIDGQRADLFQNENIEINLSVQNIKDISKVFGDFTQSFTIPASVQNNKIFKHYYNVDISGSFNASVRVDAFIEVNHNLFRAGVLELESVQVKQGQPYAYSVGFFSNVTSLKDKFGEDNLTDLDLSAYDHTYNDTNIEAGLDGYVSGTSNSIIYPLISPVANWIYDSTSSDSGANNIWYHNGHPEHGVFYYDLKPAIKLQKILDAIESKYNITFNSDFFDSADFGKLFMWCHRRAGYMFKDQPNGFTPQKINFTAQTGSSWDLTNDNYTIDVAQETEIRYTYSITSTSDYKIELFANGQMVSSRSHSGSVSSVTVYSSREVGDVIDFRLSPPNDWDASAISISSVSFNVEYFFDGSWNDIDTISRTASQSIVSTVEVSKQMPEQKVSDFIGSLVRAFNLVIVPTGNGQYDIEPLDDWYAEGTTREITEYVDTEEVNINKPQLYRRINFKYNETEAILGEQYRLQNDIGYGDLRADFTFDGEEFDVEVGFDNMLFERLDNLNNGLSEINVGKSITRELEPYIGNPYIFYASGTITVSSNAERYGYIDMGNSENAKSSFWFASNVNATTAANVTKTLNFGTEIDPYLLQGFSQGLYNTYWQDYITDLYDTQRRVFKYKAQLPLGIMLALKVNDKLTIGERNYIINQLKLNLTTGEAEMELLNDV